MKSQFVQFYRVQPGHFANTEFYTLCNGFSYIAKDVPIDWVLWEKVEDTTFVPMEDTVYVSCWYQFHIMTVIYWARRFPDVRFVIGGPAIWPVGGIGLIKDDIANTHNIILQDGLAEQIISKPIRLEDWSLEFPHKDRTWIYSYHVSTYCYWGKCIFCSYALQDIPKDTRGYDMEPLKDAPPGIVFLAIPAIPPNMMHILPDLNYDNKRYQVYMRGDTPSYKALKKIISKIPDPTKLIVRIGVEFPSNRMLSYMQKNVTIEELLKFVNLCTSYNMRVVLSYITSWGVLTPSDITDARSFFAGIEDIEDKNIIHTYRKLVVLQPVAAEASEWPNILAVCGRINTVCDAQKELDRQWIDILKSRRSSCYDARPEYKYVRFND